MSGEKEQEIPESLLSLPENPAGYVVILAALLSAGIHLLLAPRVMGFNQVTGILFILNGVGWITGVWVYISRYWRREFYIALAIYALLTIVAFFAMSGPINPFSIASKTSEAVVILVSIYLYLES